MELKPALDSCEKSVDIGRAGGEGCGLEKAVLRVANLFPPNAEKSMGFGGAEGAGGGCEKAELRDEKPAPLSMEKSVDIGREEFMVGAGAGAGWC